MARAARNTVSRPGPITPAEAVNEPMNYDTFHDDLVARGAAIRLGLSTANESIKDCMKRFMNGAADGVFNIETQFDKLWSDWKFGVGAAPAKLTVSHTSERSRLRTLCNAAIKAAPAGISVPDVIEKARKAFEAVRDTAKTDKDAPKAVQFENGLAQIGTYLAEHGNITDDIIRAKMTVKVAPKPVVTGNPVVIAADTLLDDINALLKMDAPAELKMKLRLAVAEIANLIDPLRAPAATPAATATEGAPASA